MSYKTAKYVRLGDYIYFRSNTLIEARKVNSLELIDTNSGEKVEINGTRFMLDHSACVDLRYFTSFEEAKESQINKLTDLLVSVGSQTDPTPKS